MIRDPVAVLLRIYLALTLLFVFAPVLSLTLMSFQADKIQSFPIHNFSAKWYGEAWSNRNFREGFFTSLKVAALAAPIATTLGFVSAHVLVRYRPRRAMLYIALVSVPALVPLLLSGMALLMYYQQIHLYGSVWAIVAAHVCYCSPFALGLIRNSYESLNIEVEQAAQNLGASAERIVFQIVIPQLWPALVSAAAISFLLSWDEFILAWFVGGFTKTLPTVIYGTLGTTFDPSVNALGLMILLLSCSLLVTSLLMQHLMTRTRRAPQQTGLRN
jgi:spermidine/putrescine transport system permease protein